MPSGKENELALDHRMETRRNPLEEMLGLLSRQVMNDGRYDGDRAMRFIDASHALHRAAVVLDGVDLDGHLLSEQPNDAVQVVVVPAAADLLNSVVALVQTVVDLPTGGDADYQVATERVVPRGTVDRIGTELNDFVIQPIFAASLGLQGAIQYVDDPAVSQRIEATIEELDKAIRQIRSLMFSLNTQDG